MTDPETAAAAELARLGEAYFAGAHCLTTTNPSERYRYEYEPLAFHESVPGHHLQLATTPGHVRSEVDRYIAWPGQALAYVTGKREIVRLRERAQHS